MVLFLLLYFQLHVGRGIRKNGLRDIGGLLFLDLGVRLGRDSSRSRSGGGRGRRGRAFLEPPATSAPGFGRVSAVTRARSASRAAIPIPRGSRSIYFSIYIYIYIISIAWKWGSFADLDASLNQRIPVPRATPSPPGRRRALGSRGSIAASGSSLIEHVSAFRGRSGTSRDGPISHFAQGVLESGKETETIIIEVNDSRKRFLTYREVSPPLRLLISSFFSSSKA